MSEVLAPIDKAGRIVLPKEIRDELEINPGDVLSISTRGGEVTLRPRREKRGLIRKGRALVFSSGDDSIIEQDTVNTILGELRNGGLKEISRGLAPARRNK
jgi:AbrB family looped-hinge helix DNA binding protein